MYHFLERCGLIAQSPVVYVTVSRGKWAIERDLLAHTRRRFQAQRREIQVKEPVRRPTTISEQEFQIFVNTVSDARSPQADLPDAQRRGDSGSASCWGCIWKTWISASMVFMSGFVLITRTRLAQRQDKGEIDLLYGKLAAASPLTDAELQKVLVDVLNRLAKSELPRAVN